MFGLTDLALQLVVGAILMAGSIAAMRADFEDLLTKATAQYVTILQNANNMYVQTYLEVLGTLAPGSITPTTLTVSYGPETAPKSFTYQIAAPLNPTVSDLIALKILPASFGQKTPMRQTVSTTLTPTNCPGTSCTIAGILNTTASYKDSSGTVRSDMIADVVAQAGEDAGGVYASTPATLTGFGNHWSQNNPVPGNPPAILAMRVGSSATAGCSSFVCYRRDGLYPLTRALAGGGQDINNVANVNASGTVTAKNAALQNGQSVTFGGVSSLYGDTTNMALRANGATYVQTATGAPGNLHTGLLSFNESAANCSSNQVTMRGNNQMWICNPYGNWIPINQVVGNIYTTNKFLGYNDGAGVPKPACAAGGQPNATIIPQSTGVNVAVNPPVETTRYALNDQGTWWSVSILMQDANGNWSSGNNLGLTVEIDTQCQYANQ